MDDKKLVLGAGGGGGGKGGSGKAKEETDSLRSEQYASVLDLLCEGEIEGIEGGPKGIFLEDTPVQNADGSFNFDNFTVVALEGTQGQPYIPDPAGGIQVERGVGVEITNGVPVTRSITNSDVDKVRVTINVPSLQQINDDGDILGYFVDIKIQLQYDGGGFNDVVSDRIAGKSSSLYQRDYLVEFNGNFPVDLRVVRVSADETSTKKANTTILSSFTEIQDDKLAYPNSAVVGMRFGAEQFQSIPTRKYLIRGLKIRIPHNGTVDTTTHLGRISYSGLFNGTLGAATWSNDPAWCLYDLLTDTRYGCSVPASTLDVFDFYEISRYCSELVPDGKGGQEPRFSLNLLLNSRAEVYNVIQQLTSIFRGISYYGAGSLVLRQDKPTDSQYLLGPSNVVDGLFSYSGTAEKTRHTCASVAWQSYDTLGDIEYEYVEDHESVAKYGIIRKDIRSVGCYSQGQAHRLGKWLLTSERLLSETVSFAVSIDAGIAVTPGIVIDIADPLRAGTRRSGRVSSATTTVVTIDSTTDLLVDLTLSPTLSVLLPTGLVETKTISGISGTAITVGSAFSQAPQAEAVYLIQTNDVQSQQYRVISVAEGEGGTVGVTAVAYNESIYAAVERDIALTTRDISNLSIIPSAPENLTGTEFLYQEGQSVHTGFDLSWQHSRANTTNFVVQYKLDDDNFTTVETSNPSLTLRTLRAGTLKVQISALNYLGKKSTTSQATFIIAGKTALPGNVQNLTIEPISANSARLKWSQTVDLDVKVGGKVHVRHSSLTNGAATFANSVDLINAIAGSSTDVVVPLLEGEYIVKFADDGGRLSPDDTSVLVDLIDPVGKLLVKNHREDQQTPLPFQGTHVDTFYSSEYDALTLDGSGLIDSVANFDLISIMDFLGDVKPLGTYTFLDTIDMGLALDAVEFQRRFVTRGFLPSDTMDGRTALINTWTDIDGAAVNNVNAELYIRSTNDNPSGSPTYGAWAPFNSGTFKGRGFQFKTELSSGQVDENILVDELGYKIELTPRFDQSVATIASGTSTKSVTFVKPFFVGTAALLGANSQLPSVGITVQNLGPDERFNISNVSSTGFDIDVLNASNNNVDRNFTYVAAGVGRGQ
ncbi:phage-related protein tail component-like protein [uncultured Mediterranean phage uvMED]|nr:phage-related protein tail component-like protein [uncultured Mediterranean phage uvMED]